MSSNRLTASETERLAILSEECSEVIKIIGKILRHGYENRHPDKPTITNREELVKEIGHISAALGLMLMKGDVRESDIRQSRIKKQETIKPWLHHQ